MEIRDWDIVLAWKKAMKRILEFGDIKYDNSSNKCIELDEPMIIYVKELSKFNMPKLGSLSSDAALKAYDDQFFQKNVYGFSYTYGDRILKNIDKVIQKLTNDINSRQSISLIWNSAEDYNIDFPPCMILADFRVYNNKLNTVIYLRSNDIYGAYLQDVHGILGISRCISKKLFNHEDLGKFTSISNSPHIYYRDARDAILTAYPDEYWRENILRSWNLK